MRPSTGTILDKLAGYLLTPFDSLEVFLASIAGAITAFTDLRSRTGWLYLLTSFAIASVVYAVGRKRGAIEQNSLMRFLFPREIYGQRSAIADYKFVAIDLTVKSVLYTPLITVVSLLVYKAASGLVGGWPLWQSAAGVVSGSIAVPILAVLAADFALFFYHYLMHKVPILWYFHQPHHSAEVLTPLTVYRQHPVEDLLYGMVAGAISGMGATIYTIETGKVVTVPTIFEVNVVQFLFFAFAFQLRHSHVWLSYGPVLSRIFISPAQHQVHHSRDPRHWNKNFGFAFAFWDALFRSLYVPKAREVLSFGLNDTDPGDFLTVKKLYFLPFVKAARLFRAQARDVLSPILMRK